MTTVNYAESNEELVNQIANFRNIQSFWLARTGESVSAWGNYLRALDAEIAYILALKDRMIEQRKFFIESATHVASIDGAATHLNEITPVIERKHDGSMTPPTH